MVTSKREEQKLKIIYFLGEYKRFTTIETIEKFTGLTHWGCVYSLRDLIKEGVIVRMTTRLYLGYYDGSRHFDTFVRYGLK